MTTFSRLRAELLWANYRRRVRRQRPGQVEAAPEGPTSARGSLPKPQRPRERLLPSAGAAACAEETAAYSLTACQHHADVDRLVTNATATDKLEKQQASSQMAILHGRA